jgi:hypothetical protein
VDNYAFVSSDTDAMFLLIFNLMCASEDEGANEKIDSVIFESVALR